MPEHIDFEVFVKKMGNGYRVEVEALHEKICEEVDGGDIPDTLEIPQTHILKENDIFKYGSQLFDCFITQNVKTFFDNCYFEAEKQGKILRFMLRTDEDSREFFWELLYNKKYYFLCLNPNVSFTRVISPRKISTSIVNPPLKILLVTSNPLGIEEELNLYAERDKIKWELKDMEDSGNLHIYYTDISAAKNINERLTEGYHIFHYSGHGTLDDGEAYMLLEDKNGYPKPTNINDLQPSIIGSETQLVVFDACKLAAASEKIMQFGIPAFIGMQETIADCTATTFFEEFYRVLGAGETIDVAFQKARSKLIATYGLYTIDWAIPVLFLNTKGTTLEMRGEAQRVRKPFQELSALPSAPKFVGRRSKIQEIQNKIQDEDIKILLVHGYGGVGKTSLVSKVLKELQGYTTFSIATPAAFNFGEFFQEFHEFLVKNGIKSLSEYLEVPDINQKIKELISLLYHNRFVIVFDGFEEQIEDGTIKDEGIRCFLEKVLKERIKSKVIITSKTNFEILEGRFSGCRADILLDGFYPHESYRYLSNFKLGWLESSQKEFLHKKADGHPYALEIFVGLTKKFSVEELLKDESLYRGKIEKNIVGKLLSSLESQERETLEKCAVFDVPVPLRAFEFMDVQKGVISDLLNVNLMKFERDMGLYKVHSTTRDVVLSKLENKDVEILHLKAAKFWEKEAVDTRNIWGFLKAQDHFYEGKNYERAGEITNSLVEVLHLWGYMDLSKKLLERLENKTKGPVKAGILHHLGITNHLLGDYDKAVLQYEESLKIEKELGNKRGIAQTLHQIGNVHHDKGDYDKAVLQYEESLKIEKELGNKRGIAQTLHQIGNVHYVKGDYDKAMSQYEESLKTSRELGDKRGIAITLHQIGNVHYVKGDYDKALLQYEESLKTSRELGDKRGIAFTLGQIGNVHYVKGDYDKAMSQYEESLKIKKELGDKMGIAQTLHQIGMVHHDKGDYDKAVLQYEESLKIKEELGDKRGIASTLHQIGNVHHVKGDYDKALLQYEESLKIEKELGDKRGIASTLGQMSRIYFERKDFKQAVKLTLTALAIFQYLEAPETRIAILDLQKIKETIGEQELRKLTEEVTPEVDTYLKSMN